MLIYAAGLLRERERERQGAVRIYAQQSTTILNRPGKKITYQYMAIGIDTVAAATNK